MDPGALVDCSWGSGTGLSWGAGPRGGARPGPAQWPRCLKTRCPPGVEKNTRHVLEH